MKRISFYIDIASRPTANPIVFWKYHIASKVSLDMLLGVYAGRGEWVIRNIELRPLSK